MTKIESQEAVLVVPRDRIATVAPKVFNREIEPARAVVRKNGQFLARALAEEDESFKQVIPYVVVRHRDQFLLIRRTRKQTEARLHDLYSLGIGGHINKDDVGNAETDLLTIGMRRELNEEIKVEEASCQLVGVINDNSTPVARVHVGFVYVLTTASTQFTIMEPDKYTAEWKSAAELQKFYPQMESWAQIVHDHLIS
jgi:predicted NUDIX family phosphoesterase